MVNKLISKGREILSAPQSRLTSAASVIMIMIVAAKILGFIRQRTLFSFFSPESTDIFLAAFELPDLIFEVFIYGILSAAFIPVFSRYLSKNNEKEGWRMANATLNIVFVVFTSLAIILFIFAKPLYGLIAGESIKASFGVSGGFSAEQINSVVRISRILILGQLFFVVSVFLTGVLESYKRFLVPAMAPLFYNAGIVLGTIFLSSRYGLMGPTIGAVVGAAAHLGVQVPLAVSLGFRPNFIWDTKNSGVKKLIKLAKPRVLELSLYQVRRIVWLFLASLVSGGFTYLKSADLLQTLPVGVFGTSLAKAALPTLSRQYASNDMKSFRATFVSALRQILFLVIPFSVFLVVLRVPVVRLVFGAERFDWESTVQTGEILTAFAFGIFAYAGSLLVARAFYALHDTKTPVIVSVVAILINTVLGFLFVLSFGMGTRGIALSFSISGVLQFVTLLAVLLRKIKVKPSMLVRPFIKMTTISLISGTAMFVLLKVFDRSVWVKRLSFLGTIDQLRYLPFESFVLDTRYTVNLFALSATVSAIGGLLYVGLAYLLKMQEMELFIELGKRVFARTSTKGLVKEEETVIPPPREVGE